MQIKIIKKKRIIILILILIIFGLLSFINLDKNNKNIFIKDNIENNNSNKVAIYIQQGEEYIESTLPSKGYALNKELSSCKVSTTTSGIKNAPVDNSITIEYSNGKLNFLGITKNNTRCYIYLDEKEEGITVLATINNSSTDTFPTKTSNYMPNSIICTKDATAKFNYDEWVTEVDSVDATTCTVNFTNKINQPINTYLKSKVCTDISSDDKTKDCLVQENGYRYEGEDPNNYVLFNDELWRIIGVFTVTNSSGTTEDLVKLIRYNTLDSLAWHNPGNDWSNAKLQQSLNNSYLNATDATCYFRGSNNTKTCKFSDTGIKAGVRDKIESVVWNLGGTSSASITTEAMYEAERGTKVNGSNPTTWTGHIGLMYASDYGYATLASNCARTTNLYSYNKTICAGKNWHNKNSNKWTITPSSSSNNALAVIYGGNVNSNGTYYSYGVSPSIYLKSSVQIQGGAGTYDLPYVLN